MEAAGPCHRGGVSRRKGVGRGCSGSLTRRTIPFIDAAESGVLLPGASALRIELLIMK
jgi:hypothetical protein